MPTCAAILTSLGDNYSTKSNQLKRFNTRANLSLKALVLAAKSSLPFLPPGSKSESIGDVYYGIARRLFDEQSWGSSNVVFIEVLRRLKHELLPDGLSDRVFSANEANEWHDSRTEESDLQRERLRAAVEFHPLLQVCAWLTKKTGIDRDDLFAIATKGCDGWQTEVQQLNGLDDKDVTNELLAKLAEEYRDLSVKLGLLHIDESAGVVEDDLKKAEQLADPKVTDAQLIAAWELFKETLMQAGTLLRLLRPCFRKESPGMWCQVESLPEEGYQLARNAASVLESTVRGDWLISRLSGVDCRLIRYRNIGSEHADRVDQAMNTLEAISERLSFVRPPFDLANVAASADAFDADLIVLDYIQRIPAPGRHDDRRGSVDATMNYIRQFADAGIAVIVVAAVARSKDKRGRSSYDADSLNLASFRESSELEFGADDAFILGPNGDDSVKLKHLKARHTEAADIELDFDRQTQSFTAAEKRMSEESRKLRDALASMWNATEAADDD